MYIEKHSHFFLREFFKIRALQSGFSVFVFWMRPFSLWYSITSMSRFSPCVLCVSASLRPFVLIMPLLAFLPFAPYALMCFVCLFALYALCHFVPLIILGKNKNNSTLYISICNEKRFEKIARVSNEVDSAIYGLYGPFFMGHHRL